LKLEEANLGRYMFSLVKTDIFYCILRREADDKNTFLSHGSFEIDMEYTLAVATPP
jgi:hypothetical protein